jgi:hypothetical protein
MALDIDVIVSSVYADVPSALRARKITPEAEAALRSYVHYWAPLAPPDRIASRCATIIRRAMGRLKLTPEEEATYEDLIQQMVERCVQFHIVAPEKLS